MSFPNIHYAYTQIDATAQMDLGQLSYAANGNVYRYVKFLDAVTYAAGHVVQAASATLNYVTNDYTGGTGIGTGGTAAKGIALAVMTQNSFGWVQVGGIALVYGDGSVAAGECVMPKSTDGQADTMAGGSEHLVFGVALDDDSTSNDPLAALALFHCQLRSLI